jgi:hypothetical protein
VDAESTLATPILKPGVRWEMVRILFQQLFAVVFIIVFFGIVVAVDSVRSPSPASAFARSKPRPCASCAAPHATSSSRHFLDDVPE